MTVPVTAQDAMLARVQSGPTSLFAQLSEGADEHVGFDLQKDKSPLVGVPFIITSATFRDGVMRGTKSNPIPTNYVSLEIVIGDVAALTKAVKRGRLSANVPFDPNERLVLNDGSTGIYRQIVSYLNSKGIIQVPAGREDGEVGECRYDTYRASWTGWDANETTDPRFEFTYLCPRGLRVSEYDSDYSADGASTFYLA